MTVPTAARTDRRLVACGPRSGVLVGPEPRRLSVALRNGNDAAAWLAVGASAVVGQGIPLPAGGYVEFSKAQGSLTRDLIAGILDGPSVRELLLVETVGESVLAEFDTGSMADIQSGDLAMFDNLQQVHNSPLLGTLAFSLDGGGTALPLGPVGLPLELPAACTLESVRLFTTDPSGSITVDIRAAAFGAAFASVVGTGTQPSIADAAVNPWSEEDALLGWSFDFAPGSWFWPIITANDGITALRVSLAYQFRYADEVLA